MIENNASNVVAAFQVLIGEIEVEINLINDIATKAINKLSYEEASKSIERANQVKAYRDKILVLYKEWQTLKGIQEGESREQVILPNKHYSDPELVTGTKPTAVSILGIFCTVSSWSDVLEQTMNTVFDLRREKFEQLMRRSPHIVARDGKRFTRARKLMNGAYIEVNLSAQDTVRRCSDILKMVASSSKDSIIVTVHEAHGKMDTRTLTILADSINIQ